MANYLISGTSRGIGLELVKQLLDLPSDQVGQIFAITRSESQELKAVIDRSNGRVKNVLIDDLTNEATVQQAIANVEESLQGRGLDILINNAGTSQPVTLDGVRFLKASQLQDILNANLVSVQVLTAAALPLLEKGEEKKIVNVSTTLSSIANARTLSAIPTHAYKVSKAALNALSTQYAIDLEKAGFSVFAVSPGVSSHLAGDVDYANKRQWLKTDLGGSSADLDPATGVEAFLRLILASDRSYNGKFLNIKVPGWEGTYDGEEVPW